MLALGFCLLEIKKAFGFLEKAFLHRRVVIADRFGKSAEFILLIGAEFGWDFDLNADIEVAAALGGERLNALFAEAENGAALGASRDFDRRLTI